MLKKDLAAAGIEYKTDEGTADFHSLRHTCGTLLAAEGVDTNLIRIIMRHSDINLTTGTYIHSQDTDLANAVNKPSPIKITKSKLAKTGTNDVPENLTANSTQNSVKIPQNTVKSVKRTNHSGGNIGNVNPCIPSSLVYRTLTRPPGLEPGTYGLEIR